MADRYLLRVTAGPTYDLSTHHPVLVNTTAPTLITSSLCTISLNVRIQNYRGLPRHSPSTSPYFSDPLHIHDQYSIAFSFSPHEDVSGEDLVFGNDFDKPVRDRLPPGFGTALKIVKWGIDPGLDGDVQADKPYLYGNAGSSINVLRVGRKKSEGNQAAQRKGGQGEGLGNQALEEGGEDGGELVRSELGVPENADKRKKWFLEEANKKAWTWEGGRMYWADFFNPYLDFNQFAMKLPGFSLSFLGYLGGDDSLRYVLKNKDTGDVYFVVVFQLLHKEDVEKAEAAEQANAESKIEKKDKKDEKMADEGAFEPGDDDVD